MPNRVLIVYDDAALASKGASIANSPSVDVNFPWSNLLNADRKVVGRSASNPGSSVDIHIDLGAAYDPAQVFGGFGLHNVQTAAPSGSGPTFDIYSSATDFVSMTLQASKSSVTYFVANRDWVEVCASPLTAQRYWKIHVNPQSYQFSIGKFIPGTGLDFGFYYSPGSGYQIFTPGTDSRTKDGDPVDISWGEARRIYRYRYDEILDAEQLPLERVARQTKPMSLLDPQGNSSHVWRPKSAPVPFEHVFGDPPGAVWNVGELVLEQMP